MTASKTNVEKKERELIISRVFDAPKDLVFSMYTTCEHLKNWWGPRTWPMAECSLDFKKGGKWHYCLRGPNEGDESWGLAIYDEINRSEKIVYRDFFSNKDSTINKDLPSMQILVEFFDEDGKTRVVTTTIPKSTEELKKLIEMGVIEGFTETWDRLEEHLESLINQNSS